MKGKAKAKVNAKGLAPQAAKSLKLTASALWPKPAAGVMDKKCRPSTNMSEDTASCIPA